MKNILTILFVLASICVFGQTKEEAFAEMNAIVKKVEGASAEKGSVKVIKQVLGKKYRLKIQKGNDILKVKAKTIPWESYSYSKVQPDYDSGLVCFSLYFDAEFKTSLKYGKTGGSGNSNEFNFYLQSADIERFEELLKIVSGKS